MQCGTEPSYHSTNLQPESIPGAIPELWKRMDRRRVNGPPGGTAPPVYAVAPNSKTATTANRTRQPNEIRKICKSRWVLGLGMGAIEWLAPVTANTLQLSRQV